MDLVIYLPLVVPLLAALAAGPLSRRLPPAAATWLLAGSALVLAAASSAVLGLLALTALFRIPLVDQVGGMSAPVFSRDDPASLPVAVAAGALLAISATAAGRALWHRGSALAAAFGQARRLPGAGQVVVTDEETADAYTLPGWPCRIVVTAGMMRALTSSEREVLLAHERAHTVWFHYLFTSAARLAVAQAAIAASADRHRRPGPVVALGAVARPQVRRGPGPVPHRVAALLRPAPRPQLLLLTAAV